ncbi:MAG: hexitol phosphatase HxpB [Bacteroidales bacterium]|nr:hexitol phosphatase HxpB [Bacteroidales bacterium]
MINGVVFDLDGVVIDSEPLWKIAEKKVFKTVGIELTTGMCRQTTGLDNMSTVRHWYSFKPWKNKSPEQVASEISDEVISLIRQYGKPKDGIMNIIDFFSDLSIPLAVASSSGIKIINAALEKIKLKDKFAAVHSSESEEFGKPHPAVYISAAGLLDLRPEDCLAFEDSFFGALAAKSAMMKVVAVLEKQDYLDSRFDFTDLKIESLDSFGMHEFNNLNQ